MPKPLHACGTGYPPPSELPSMGHCEISSRPISTASVLSDQIYIRTSVIFINSSALSVFNTNINNLINWKHPSTITDSSAQELNNKDPAFSFVKHLIHVLVVCYFEYILGIVSPRASCIHQNILSQFHSLSFHYLSHIAKTTDSQTVCFSVC